MTYWGYTKRAELTPNTIRARLIRYTRFFLIPLEVRLYTFRCPYVNNAIILLPCMPCTRKISQIFLPRTSNGTHRYLCYQNLFSFTTICQYYLLKPAMAILRRYSKNSPPFFFATNVFCNNKLYLFIR